MEKDKFCIQRLAPGDVQLAGQFSRLLQEVFEMENPSVVPEAYLEKLLGKPGFIACVVIHGTQVAGGLTAYELPMFTSDTSEIFIYDLAVKPEFQRKGLGKALISALKEYARQQGIEEIFVPASEEDQHALDFYRATGGEGEKVVHFSYSVNGEQ